MDPDEKRVKIILKTDGQIEKECGFDLIEQINGRKSVLVRIVPAPLFNPVKGRLVTQ